MKLRIATIIVTLSLLLTFSLWSVGRGVQAQVAGYPLNPSSFASLGASPFNAAGVYTIDASKNNAAPTLSGPGIVTPIAGVFHSPSNGATARDEIAVFTFSFLTIPAGVTVQGARNANSRPIALLSQSTVTTDGTLDVSGANGMNGTSGFGLNAIGGNGGNAGPGGGGGAGGKLIATTHGSGGVGFADESNGVAEFGIGGNVVVDGGGRSGLRITDGGGGAFGATGAAPRIPTCPVLVVAGRHTVIWRCGCKAVAAAALRLGRWAAAASPVRCWRTAARAAARFQTAAAARAAAFLSTLRRWRCPAP